MPESFAVHHNDAVGRTFNETYFAEDAHGRTIRYALPTAERVYTIAGAYTERLSDEEARERVAPPPIVQATAATPSTKKRRK